MRIGPIGYRPRCRAHCVSLVSTQRERCMNKLSNEAYAIIEGRHSDPFSYLGRHEEDGRDVVRAFLPGASDVSVVDSVGALVQLPRIHDDGLFVGIVPQCVADYRLQARFGDNVVELQDPYRFRPFSVSLDLYFARRRHAPAAVRQARCPSNDDDRDRRCRLRRLGTQCARGFRRRRFQFLGSAASSDARARQRILGAVHSRCQRWRPLQIRDDLALRAGAAAKSRSAGVCS